MATEPAATASLSFTLRKERKKNCYTQTRIGHELQPHAWLREHSPSRSFRLQKKKAPMPLFPRTPMTPSTGRDDFRCAHDAAPSSSASHTPNAAVDRPPNAAADRPRRQPGAGAEPHHRTPTSLSSYSAGCATRTGTTRRREESAAGQPNWCWPGHRR